MNLWQIFLCSAAVSLLLKYFVVPRLTKRVASGEGIKAIAASGQQAMASFLGSAGMMAALSALGLIVWIWWLGRTGESADSLTAGLAGLQHWRDQITEWSGVWSRATVVCVVLFFALYLRRRARLRCMAALDRARGREFDRLKELYLKGELPPLPDSVEMQKIDGRIAEVEIALGQLQAPPFSANANARATEEKLHEDLRQLQIARVVADIERRMETRLAPEDVEAPPPQGFFGRIESLLISRGMLLNLSRGRRALVLATLLLMLPAYLGVYARPVTTRLAALQNILEQRQLNLQEVELRLGAEKAREEWKRQLEGQQGAANVLSPEDLSAIDTVARDFEANRDDDPLWQSVKVPAAGGFRVQSLVARDRILSAVAEQRSARVAAQTSVREGTRANAGMRGVVRSAENMGEMRPATGAGRRFAENLREYAAKAPQAFRARVRAEAAAFRQSAKAADFRKAIFSNVVGAVGDGDASVFSEVAERVGSTERARFRTYEAVAGDRGAAAYAGGAKASEAAKTAAASRDMPAHLYQELQEVVRMSAERVPPPEQVAAAFADRPPTVDPVADEAGLRKAADAFADLRQQSSRRSGSFVNMADSVASYPDYFPGQINADEQTTAAELRRRLESGGDLQGLSKSLEGVGDHPPNLGGPGLPGFERGVADARVVRSPHLPGVSGAARSATSAAARTGQIFSSPATTAARAGSTLARARSFTALRGFSRVGGVLIGQEPKEVIHPEILDVNWVFPSPGTIQLAIKTKDGTELRSISYRSSIVYQALNYAADGRPLAVTMATAKPLFELKILLHPTLLDTPLGARIVDLDRLVDKHTGDTPDHFREAASMRVAQEHALYQVAWAARMKLASSPEAEKSDRLGGPHLRFADQLLANPQLAELAARALTSSYADPQWSPIGAKPEFYETGLVQTIKDLAGRSKNLDGFIAALRADYRDLGGEVRGVIRDSVMQNTLALRQVDASLFEKTQDWLEFPPQYEVWSGVRERALRGELSEVFVQSTDPAPRVFDFMLQVAFVSPPSFAPGARDKQETEYIDQRPWEFPSIQKKIEATVASRLTAEDRQVIDDAAQFAVLQRFFRCAFNGKFGEGFPVEKLVALGQDLRQAGPDKEWRTPRWNPRPGRAEQETAAELREISATLQQAGAAKAQVEAVDACLLSIKSGFEIRSHFYEVLDGITKSKERSTPVGLRDRLDRAWREMEAGLVAWEPQWGQSAAKLRSVASSASGVRSFTAFPVAQPRASAESGSKISAILVSAADEAAELTAVLKLRRALRVDEDERLGFELELGLRGFPSP